MNNNDLNSDATELLKNKKQSDLLSTIKYEAFNEVLFENLATQIPVVALMVGLGKAGVAVKDYLFLKKLASFLYKLQDIDESDRIEEISKIELNPDYRTGVGEKIVYIIDRCEDDEKAGVVGELFKAYLKSEIDYDDFLRMVSSVEKLLLEDLKYFVNSSFEYDVSEAGDLIGAGLLNIKFDPASMVLGSDFGGRISTSISSLGELFRVVLRGKI